MPSLIGACKTKEKANVAKGPGLSVLCVLTAVCWLVASTSDPAAGERNLARGKKLYEKYCLACHGSQGKGDGAVQFDPPVADLTSSDVLVKPDSRLLKSIHEGRPNTAMDAWKSKLSDEAILDVLAYLLTFPR
jgi:mono/diheme cytochrome c family protein